MTHPIDPLTPEALTARILWEAAKGDDILRFLDVWERMQSGHAKEVENAGYDAGYETGILDGHKEGYDMGWDDGRNKTLAEMKAKDEQSPSTS